jgi:peptidoglycan/LPS O-acetylase OafA/YrhL
MKNIFRIKIDTNRVFGLDILRALAILFVVIAHGSPLLPHKLRPINDFFIFDGVSIFFVLSGFLVGGILIRTIEKNGFSKNILLNFWIRRWFRTLPNYFLILIITCFFYLHYNSDFTIRSVSSYFIFSQNLSSIHPGFFPEAWSLSIEEWFYLLIPILIGLFIFISKGSVRKNVLMTAISVITLVTVFRYYRYSTASINSLGEWDLIFRKQVVTRLDSLMFGVIGAYAYFYYTELWLNYKKQLLILGASLFLLTKFEIYFPIYSPINGLYMTVFSFTLTSVATLFLLPYLSDLKTGEGVLYKIITYLSLTSYSMYLLNLTIIQQFILNIIPWSNITDNWRVIELSKLGMYWVLLISLSILLYKYFEIPMTKLRDNKTITKLLQPSMDTRT